VLSGRGLCNGLIIRSEESYRMWRVVVCDQETSQARRLKPTRGEEEEESSTDLDVRYGSLSRSGTRKIRHLINSLGT